MKKLTLLLAFVSLNILVFAQGPYDPPAGQAGSEAISKDSSAIQSWATGIEIHKGYIQISNPNLWNQGSNYASFGTASNALFEAEGNSNDIVSMGDSGVATLTFAYPIVNGPGKDFVVFENSFSDTYLELGFVEVSSDGEHFARFPAHSLTQYTMQIGAFGSVYASEIDGFAGKYRQGYGVGFDLDSLADTTNIDMNNIRFVRIIDCIGAVDTTHSTYDAYGNIVNDPFPTPFWNSGFDLDGVGVINQGIVAYEISETDELPLGFDSFWNGSDLSGGFSSGIAYFPNFYDTAYYSWSGFSYSNMRDDSTIGYANQYSAISAGGMYAPDSGGTNYVVSWVSPDWMSPTFDPLANEVSWTDTSQHIVSGFYVTNSTWAYLAMLNGDGVSKQFGGTSGNDPDYYKLLIYGERADSSITDTVEFFLADYRFSNNDNDYIIDSWTWVDLYKLGEVKKLYFSVASSDVGTYGINTPTYFCMDNLMVYPANFSSDIAESNHSIDFTVYPNPSNGLFKIHSGENNNYDVFVYDLSGRMATHLSDVSDQHYFDFSHLDAGMYIMQLINDDFSGSAQIIIE
ncbi:MAG: hypothetical protein C0592_06890 [Marinilabiliales bacterium]|nr:MAG: hypothetical protein C0592_06890 [Marinilabiliales bacterium]